MTLSPTWQDGRHQRDPWQTEASAGRHKSASGPAPQSPRELPQPRRSLGSHWRATWTSSASWCRPAVSPPPALAASPRTGCKNIWSPSCQTVSSAGIPCPEAEAGSRGSWWSPPPLSWSLGSLSVPCVCDQGLLQQVHWMCHARSMIFKLFLSNLLPAVQLGVGRVGNTRVIEQG